MLPPRALPRFFASKIPALDALAKHLGILREPAGGDGEKRLSLEDARLLLEMWEQRDAARAEKQAEAIETTALDVPVTLNGTGRHEEKP